MRAHALALLLTLTCVSHRTEAAPAAPEAGSGPVTKLPLPRYASLKTDRVNLREGPSKDHNTQWVFRRAGLPIEIIGEFETWRRIRDSEGTEGWVLHSLLSGRRTAVVNAPSGGAGANGTGAKATEAKATEAKTVSLYASTDERSGEEARLEGGVIGSVKKCTGAWCRIIVSLPQKRGDVDGYIRQDRLWGVYPNETLD